MVEADVAEDVVSEVMRELPQAAREMPTATDKSGRVPNRLRVGSIARASVIVTHLHARSFLLVDFEAVPSVTSAAAPTSNCS